MKIKVDSFVKLIGDMYDKAWTFYLLSIFLNDSINGMDNAIGANEIRINNPGFDSVAIGIFTDNFSVTTFEHMGSNFVISSSV